MSVGHAPMSFGKRTRCSGNQFFQKAMSLRLESPAKAVPLFVSANQAYQTALQNIDPTNDLASCSKNLGISCFRLGGLLQALECGGLGTPLPSVGPSLSFLQEALTHIATAIRAGHRTKPALWVSDMQEQQTLLCDVLQPTMASKPRDERIRFLRKHASDWSPARLSQLWNAVAEAHFFCGVRMQGEEALDSAANEFQHAKQAAERGMECGPDAESKQDLQTLLDGIYVNCCTAERENLIRQGMAGLRRALLEDEVLDVEALWDAMDDFKQTMILASRDKYALHEAIASSKIGVIFYRCLKMKDRSRKYFSNAIQLALSLQPVDVSQEEWYKEASLCEQEIQRAAVQEEAKQEHLRRGKYMDRLKPEFDVLDAKKAQGFEAFVSFLLNNYPPPRAMPTSEEKQSSKKRLLFAIRAYHPDKVPDGSDDESKCKFYLYEHIAKLLNDIYEQSEKGATLDATSAEDEGKEADGEEEEEKEEGMFV